jgi:hypothetical protein
MNPYLSNQATSAATKRKNLAWKIHPSPGIALVQRA